MDSFLRTSWFTAGASAALAFAFLLPADQARAQLALGTGFTYQGSLTDGGAAANGVYDFTFDLFAIDTGGMSLGTATLDDATVTQGVFTATLDFGAQFDGNRRWLEIGVRPGADTGAYTTLSPRVELTAAPHAIYAVQAGNAATADSATTADTATSADDADLFDGMDSTEFALPSDIDWNLLANIPAGFADNVDDVDDGDTTTTNELNTGLALSGTELQLLDAGGTLTLDLAPLDTDDQTLEEVLTTGLDAGGLDAVNLGLVGIGTAAPTEELTMEGGTFLQTPLDPVHVGAIGDSGTTELDGAYGLAVAGRYAYVASLTDDGVEILDISDPANPTHVGAITNGAGTQLNGVRGIAVAGGYAYLASYSDSAVVILDVSDPANPTHAGSIVDDAATGLVAPQAIAVAGRYAYVTSFSDNTLQILDVSDPTNPTAAGRVTVSGAFGVAVAGNYAYVAGYFIGVRIVDVSDPENPTVVGSLNENAANLLDGPTSIEVRGRYAYVTSSLEDGVAILDVSDPANPTQVGAIADDATTELNGAFRIALAGNYAFVTAYDDDGVEVLDISDPTNPTHVGSISDGGSRELNGPRGIVVAGRYAYVASQDDDGFEVLDIGGIQAPGAHLGAIFTDRLDVAQDAAVGQQLRVYGGLDVGAHALVGGDLAVRGEVWAEAFAGDGSALTNLPGGDWSTLTGIPADFADDTDDVGDDWTGLTNVPAGFADDTDDVGDDWTGLTNVPAGFADDVDDVDDADADATNERITALGLTGTTLRITEAGTLHTQDLSALQDGTGTDDQTIGEVLTSGNDANGEDLVGLGDVGIGIDIPLQTLHIAGTGGTDGIRFPDGTDQTTAYRPLTGTYAFATTILSAGTRLADTMTVTGAQVGDYVVLNCRSRLNAGLVLGNARVSGANTVEFTIENFSASNATISSTTFHAIVFPQ